MRYIFLLLLALGSTSLYAQYPNSVNKMRLGTQTTGDGLIYRHSGVPNWTPTGLVNSWQSIDTTTGNLWAYRSGEWRLEVAGDLQQVYPKVINKSGVNIKRGEVVGVDTSQIIQGDLIRIMRAIGDGGLQSNLIMGVAAIDINDNAEGYVVWFGYVREVVEANIAQTGDTLNAGDILYLSSTQPGRYTKTEPTPPALKTTIALVVRKPSANNMTLLVRPKLNEDLSDLNDVDLNGINNGQTIVWDSINTKWIAGDVGTTDVTSITAGVGLTGGTITSTGTIAADTAGVLVTKAFLTNQGYTTNTGTVTGTGANGRVSFWTGTNSQSGDDGLFWSNTNKWLGVGTTTPQAKLEVASTSGFSEVRSRTADSTSFAAFSVRNNNPSPFLSGIIRGSAHTGTLFGLPNANGAQLYSVATDYLVVGTFSSIPLVFGTNNAERMRILSGGNVGIGTTTPSVRLDVAGTDAIRIPTGTTAQRPGTPLAGMARNNTTNNNLDFYTGTAWENYAKSAYATGLYTATRIPFADANGRLTDTVGFTWDRAVLNIQPTNGVVSTGNTFIRGGNTTTTGNANVAIGVGVLQANTTGRNNTGIGFQALSGNTTGNDNSVVGYQAMRLNTTGFSNVAMGLQVLENNTSGFNNTAQGERAMQNNTTGTNNIGFGYLALRFNTTGNNSTAIGQSALRNATTGSFNVAIGSNAGFNSVTALTGNSNILIGTNAAQNIEGAAAGNLIIGNDISLPTATGSNQVVIKNLIFGTDASGTGTTIASGSRVGIKTNAPNRDFEVVGEVRITDLTTDPPTRIVGADADGDLGEITVGSGLSLSSSTLSRELNYAVITVDSNRTSTFLAASVTPDTIDNPKLSQVGGVFSVLGNGIQYTSGTSRTFLITANADFKFSEANNVVKFQGWRSNGGTVIDLGTFGTVESLLGNEIMHTSFSAITSLSNNDLLRFGFTPGAHTGDDDLVLTNLSITITQL
jgi:hypothetical protein